MTSNMPPELFGLGTTFGVAQQLGGLANNNLYPNAHSPNFTTTVPSPSAFKLEPPSPANFVSTAPLMSPTTNIPTTSPNYMQSSGPTTAAVAQHDHQLGFEADVLEAAALLQNGSHHRSHSMHSESGLANNTHHRPNNSMGPPVGHLRHQALSEFKQDGRRMSQTQSNDEIAQQETWGAWIFGDNRIQSAPRAAQPVPQVLQYGTDQQFNRNNQPFVPQNKKESLESMESEHLRYMKAVELSHSTDTTRAPSPVFDPSAFNLKTRSQPKSLKIDSKTHESARSKKSRAGEDGLDEDEEPQSAVSKSSARKRKSKTGGDSTNSPGAEDAVSGQGKRRKSTAAVRRDNLTEVQKRENHINSEKKRRKVIQVGFENLGVIVPGLGLGGNLSKSAMLETTVAFLQELLDGNQALRDQLAQMS